MIERDILKFEITPKKINRKFIFLNPFDELSETVYYDFLYDCFDHYLKFKWTNKFFVRLFLSF